MSLENRTPIFVKGVGAVSPAGWGVAQMRRALTAGMALPTEPMTRPGWTEGINVRRVPLPAPKPAFFSHARFRRTSPISQFAVGAATEALGADTARVGGELQLGVVLTVLSGCVNYSRRFYDETLRDPSTASPVVFPETVFNAPASHIASMLGSREINYTLVGDPGTFLQGLELGADWLRHGLVDGCVVIGSEEMDWLTADAFRLFHHPVVLSEGAGALYLTREKEDTAVELELVTQPALFLKRQPRAAAALKMQAQLGVDGDLLVDGLQSVARLDRAEAAAWRNWSESRISPKCVLGEGLMAAAAWQCVAAVDAIQQRACARAAVSVVGCNEQAVGARFRRLDP